MVGCPAKNNVGQAVSKTSGAREKEDSAVSI